MPFITLLTGIFIMLLSQTFYRYSVVFHFITNWRVMDVFTILLLFIVNIKQFNKKLTNKSYSEYSLYLMLMLYVVIGIIAVIRGLEIIGTNAIGIGRYSLLDIFFIPIFISIVTSKSKLFTLLKYISLIIIPILIILLFTGYKGLHGDRFTDSFTALGIANMSVMLTPFLFNKSDKRTVLGNIPISMILLFSFAMIILAQHRSVWVATTVGIIMVFFLTIRYKFNIYLILKILLIGFIFIFALYVIKIYFIGETAEDALNQRLTFLHGMKNDPTGYWRFRGWEFVISETINNNFFWGAGFSGAGWIDKNTEIVTWEHNQYVHFFRATGLLGIIIYLLFILTSLKYSLDNLSNTKLSFYKTILIGNISSFIMTLIYMLFYNQPCFLWINLALIIITSRLNISEYREISEKATDS
jgi:hypothetical protein